MIQAIKDLADAFVPSGRLIELVDITLVSATLSPWAVILRITDVFLLSQKTSWIQYVYYPLQPLMADTLPYPFSDEIKGVAAASGIPLGK